MPGKQAVIKDSNGGSRRCMQSFAKNAGLYGERVGSLHIVAPDQPAAERVKSQLSVLQRSEISNPPSHGARLVGFPYRFNRFCPLYWRIVVRCH